MQQTQGRQPHFDRYPFACYRRRCLRPHNVLRSVTPAVMDMKTTMTLQALIFDLDGVLTDTAELHYRTWRRLAAEEGIPFDPSLGDRLRSIPRRASLEIILGGRTVSETQMAALLTRKNEHFLALLNQVTPADLLPGVSSLLDEARVRGLRCAVASSSQNAHAVLERLGIRGRFDVICDGHSVSNAKPAPDLFLLAAARLGVSPRACLVFEDAPAGITAAQAAGMRAVGVGPAERVAAADLAVPSLAGVRLADLLQIMTNRQGPATGGRHG